MLLNALAGFFNNLLLFRWLYVVLNYYPEGLQSLTVIGLKVIQHLYPAIHLLSSITTNSAVFKNAHIIYMFVSSFMFNNYWSDTAWCDGELYNILVFKIEETLVVFSIV